MQTKTKMHKPNRHSTRTLVLLLVSQTTSLDKALETPENTLVRKWSNLPSALIEVEGMDGIRKNGICDLHQVLWCFVLVVFECMFTL